MARERRAASASRTGRKSLSDLRREERARFVDRRNVAGLDYYVVAYRWLAAVQGELSSYLSAALREAAQSGQFRVGLIAGGLALGGLHALTPGHGKSIVMSYFLGRSARYGDGAAMAVKIATSHTLSAILLVLFFGGAVTLLGRPSGAAETLQTASYALISMIGAYYLYQATFNGAPSHHSHLLPVAVGVLPCPLTMLVVGSAMAQGATGAGLVLAAVMGAGAAATIAFVGLTSIAARRLVLGRVDPANAWLAWSLRVLEIASSAAIMLIGTLFFFGRL